MYLSLPGLVIILTKRHIQSYIHTAIIIQLWQSFSIFHYWYTSEMTLSAIQFCWGIIYHVELAQFFSPYMNSWAGQMLYFLYWYLLSFHFKNYMGPIWNLPQVERSDCIKRVLLVWNEPNLFIYKFFNISYSFKWMHVEYVCIINLRNLIFLNCMNYQHWYIPPRMLW